MSTKKKESKKPAIADVRSVSGSCCELIEKIAFRTQDRDMDVWAEDVLLFDNDDDVLRFFKEDNPALIDHYTDDDDRCIYDLEIINTQSNHIIEIKFKTHYAGNVELIRMNAGYICNFR